MSARPRTLALAGGVLLLGTLACGWYFLVHDGGDPRLAGYVRSKPRLAVVFTSRSEPASFRAATRPE